MTYVLGTPAEVGDVYTKGPVELRCGDCRDVLSDVEPDAVICDPPYSPRQAAGFRSGNDYRRLAREGGPRGTGTGIGTITAFQGMPYAPMDLDFARAAIARFEGVAWFVAFGDHVSFRFWERAADEAGRYAFAPVIWLRGNGPRFQGDGPCCAVEFIAVSRPRRKTTSGSLPGYYDHPPLKRREGRVVTGQKPARLMRALVRDYSRPGDLVCDPCAGGATTLIAAALEGRRAIGAELDPETFAKACARIERTALTPPLPGLESTPMTQESMWGD